MEKIVIYNNRFGSTEYYAQAIAEGLSCQAIEESQIKVETLEFYDVIILGGCLLEGEISGADKFQSWINLYPTKHWIIYTVGLSDPQMTDFNEIYASNFSQLDYQMIPIFNFKGSITYKRITLMSQLAHQAKLKKIKSLDNVNLTKDQVNLLKKYHTTADQHDLVEIEDLINYVYQLEEGDVNDDIS